MVHTPPPAATPTPARSAHGGGSKRHGTETLSVAKCGGPSGQPVPRNSRAPEPDAELLRLGADFGAACAAEREAEAKYDDDLSKSERSVLYERANNATIRAKAIAERILELRATTLPGLLIKARVASWCHTGEPIDANWLADVGMSEPFETTDSKAVLSIMLDLAGLYDASLPAAPAARAA